MSAPSFASPKAAELAAALGLDAADLTGTGKNGTIRVADVRQAGPPPAPDDLGSDGRRLWDGVQAENELRPDEEAQLLAACQLVDEIDRMRAALDGADVVVTGSKGQRRAHPLVGELRAHRLALGRLLGGLGLQDFDDPENAGSVAGRKLARTRWDGRRG